MNKNLLIAAALILASNTFAAVPIEQATKAVEARKEIFKEIAELNKPLGLMLRRTNPVDSAIVAANTQKIGELAVKIPDAYKTDTQAYPNLETRALPSIWSNPSDFEVKAKQLQEAANASSLAAKSGDAEAITKSLIQMGRVCGNCHDGYRSK